MTEADYRIVIDPHQPMESRTAAFYRRGVWLRNLGLDKPHLDQIEAMIDRFGELGLIEKRDTLQPDTAFPSVM